MIDVGCRYQETIYPRIAVIGVGGGGGNAVINMIANNVRGVSFVLANTDAQALNRSTNATRIQLGRNSTDGLGAGSSMAIGRRAAEESIDEIVAAISGCHMVFIAAGMGGGTGTGASPVIAREARRLGILTVGVVTKPFGFEGRRRAMTAEGGIAELEKNVDTLIVIPNQNLFRVASPQTTLKRAFEMADEILQQGVRGITDLMVVPGLVNLDFADVCSVMGGMGKAMMGSAEAEGSHRAMTAAIAAISNPILDGVMDGARGLIISVAGGEDLRLSEIDEVAGYIKDLLHVDAEIIWGSTIDPALEGRIRVSVVVTGLNNGGEIDQAIAALPRPPEREHQLELPSFWFAQTTPFPADAMFADEAAEGATLEKIEDEEMVAAAAATQPLPGLGGPPARPPHGMSLFERVVAMATGADDAALAVDPDRTRDDRPLTPPRARSRAEVQSVRRASVVR